ncbi:hypothetical protein DFP72DRAFT_920725 [Ephemerocybe angulata]|uniref:F-box domain-containing protein n=1 Tax=Ephemerocybe angulata TaxID=980116 RepID=A0A8H6LYX9_9AGAR|nr:hypothetical protein DFP72DRAFT_920725 [Tulosesus angulatus]
MAHVTPLAVELTDIIPQEIIEVVIAFAGANSPKVLKNTSLVSHAWEASSRPHLFSYIHFTTEFVRWLVRNLGAWQRILPHIRRACFSEESNKLMSKLRNLTFVGCSSELTAIVGRILKEAREITTLALCELSFRSSVRVLKLHEVWWDKGILDDVGTKPAFAAPRKLRSITLDCTSEESSILFWLARGSSGSIRVADVEGDTSVSQFTHIETLSIGETYSRTSSALRTLSGFKALGILTMKTPIPLKNHQSAATSNGVSISASPMPWYSILLSSVSSSLHYLSLRLAWCNSEEELEFVDWGTLNDLLANSPSYAELREITITGNIRRHDSVLRDGCVRLIRQKIVRLQPGTQLVIDIRRY